jgi:hypothetical protein
MSNYSAWIANKLQTLDQQTKARCEDWIATVLANGGALEPADITVPDQWSLAGTRSKISRCLAEIAKLTQRPQPPPDIEARVAAFVAELGKDARPKCFGLGRNERLTVVWPTPMNPLSPQQLIAAIAPQLLTQHLLDVIAQESKALPTPAEQHRLGRVQGDLMELRYFEEILTVREGGTRASDAPVEAILGCRVTRRAGRAA